MYSQVAVAGLGPVGRQPTDANLFASCPRNIFFPYRPTGPAVGRPEDKLRPVPTAAVGPDLRRDGEADDIANLRARTGDPWAAGTFFGAAPAPHENGMPDKVRAGDIFGLRISEYRVP
jgi:hypothetical protein